MTGLRISDDLELPIEAVTETIAILAKRGMGKSNAGVVMAEEMWDVGCQWVAIDPKGDWHGIRSSADGEGVGLPVPVFGGRHGDIPLEAGAGTLMATLVAERHLTCVLDVSLFSKAEQIRFVTDFAETLFRAVGDDPRPLHLFLEEAEEFLPQRVDARSARMVGAYSKISKQGRAFGLGVTLITQRSASLNKDALSQTDTLVLFRTVSPHDRKAVVAWAEHHDEAKDVSQSLAELEPGVSWLLSPGFLGRIDRIRWRRRRTFDSGATPKPGMQRVGPAQRATVDLDELREQMAKLGAPEPVQVSKGDGAEVSRLRQRIATLEAELAAARAEVRTVEVPALGPADHDRLAEALMALTTAAEPIAAALGRIPRPSSVPTPPKADVAPTPAVAKPPRPASAPRPSATGDEPRLGRAERAILTVLAQHPTGRTRVQLALLTGYSIKSSSLGNALGALRSLGLVSKGGEPIQATQDGFNLAATFGDAEPLPTGQALYAYWAGRLGRAERAVLDVLVAAWPEPLTKDDIAARTGYSATSSSLGNALGKLRSLDLVDGWAAHDDFVEAIR